jgi:hypothetical protein
VLVSAPVLGKLAHVGYSEYEQLPSTLYMLSFDNQKALKPIRTRQITGGVLLADNPRAMVMIEAYDKLYNAYPVAQNFPQLSLANIADTFGQAFLMFPMTSAGKGVARGVEMTVKSRVSSRLELTGSLTYSRAWYSGLDGVLRKGNFDLPVVANLSGVWNVGHSVVVSGRFSTTSGRAYTPDDLATSLAQNRDVYNLTQINGARSKAYERLDFRVEQGHKMGLGVMTWHIGLQNALNHKNFYANVWEPNNTVVKGAGEQDQMPLFPDGGIKYSF